MSLALHLMINAKSAAEYNANRQGAQPQAKNQYTHTKNAALKSKKRDDG